MTILPLYLGGAISEMYTGATTEEAPMLSPLTKRKNINAYTLVASAAPTEVTRNKMPIQIRVCFLPILFAGIFPKAAPNAVPYNAMAIAVPCIQSDKDQSC